MKRKVLLILLAMLVGIAMIMTTACSTGGSTADEEPMTLEKYVEGDPEVQQSIDRAMSDSNVLVEVKENSIVYSFDLSKMDGYTEELVHTEEIQSALQSAIDGAGGTFGGVAKQVEETSGLTGITAVVNYTWGDEVIVTKTFTSADAPTA